ncbi:MAG: hypothetical protein KJ793_01765, partial [Candidatus Omnitrophica bacterium]|nr:hypothetical protein [Candidatus Omnitrophota bacterium]
WGSRPQYLRVDGRWQIAPTRKSCRPSAAVTLPLSSGLVVYQARVFIYKLSPSLFVSCNAPFNKLKITHI